MGFKSTASAKYYLDKLEEQGAIRKGDNKNRAIEIVEKNTKDKDNANVSQFKSDNIKNVNEVFANLISVPMLGNVAAGSPLYAEVENDTSYTIPADFFNCKGQMFLLNVKRRKHEKYRNLQRRYGTCQTAKRSEGWRSNSRADRQQ